jgi:hypothetical protein
MEAIFIGSSSILYVERGSRLVFSVASGIFIREKGGVRTKTHRVIRAGAWMQEGVAGSSRG